MRDTLFKKKPIPENPPTIEDLKKMMHAVYKLDDELYYQPNPSGTKGDLNEMYLKAFACGLYLKSNGHKKEVEEIFRGTLWDKKTGDDKKASQTCVSRDKLCSKREALKYKEQFEKKYGTLSAKAYFNLN